MLRKLLLSILECSLDSTLIKTVDIIIVDNDSEKTAEETVSGIKTDMPSIFRMHYFPYAEKGLSNVRNELLRQASLMKPDFIDFIDDDEYVSREWLNELMRTIIACDSDAVRGPVIAVTEKKVSPCIQYWFNRENYPDRSRVYYFTTGNLLLRYASLQKYNVWFDERFNKTGAEDVNFGNQLMNKGASIFWAANAVTWETIPESRTSLYWIMKRKFRGATNYVYSLKQDGNVKKIVIKFLVSIYYIVTGIPALVIILLPVKIRYIGLIRIWEGLGGISGLINVRSAGY